VEDPRSFLEPLSSGAILDEIQRVPDLLSYLQGMIDADRKKGRFILTGSHQPQVHKAISQSLAGRTAVLELMPFSLTEIREYKDSPNQAFELIHKGFYPGVYENKLNTERFYRSYVATYVERDVRDLIQLTDLTSFEKFLHLIAGRIGQLVNYSSIANDVGVTAGTVKNWISILKASYILFELTPWYANIRKRLVKSSKLYFVDVGLASWLLGLTDPSQVERDPLRGMLYENMCVLEVVKMLRNRGERPQLHFYRDVKGNEVDLLVHKTHIDFVAVEIKSSATFQPEFIKGIDSFKRTAAEESMIHAKVWYNGDQQMQYKDADVCNPLTHGFDW
jgi:predicted AAA+ superfamily ATPase